VHNLLPSNLLSKIVNIKIYRIVLLLAVLYGCETWSLTLREERRLGVLKNTVLKRISGPMRNEVTRKWRKIHNEELTNLFSWPNIFRFIKSKRIRYLGM